MKILRLLLILLAALPLHGCSSDSASSTQASVVVSTAGSLPTGSALAGVGLTITLPSGVAPPMDATGQVDGNRLVTATGVSSAGGLAVTAIQLEAESGQPARLSLVTASKAKDGFGIGETMTLNLQLTKGTRPNPSDFSVIDFAAADLNGNEVTGLQTSLALR